MNTYHRLSIPASNRSGFTLVECLVVAAILFILAAVMLPTLDGYHSSPANEMMQQGTQMYKIIFSEVLDNPDPEASLSLFPSSTNGFTTSTQYFVHLVTNRTLNVDFSFFTGKGLPKHRTTDPAQFKSDGNAWSLVLDVKDQIASYPFLLSRNLLPAATNVPPKSAVLAPASLGETGKGRKLEFNTKAGVVITKAGTGFIIKQRDLAGGAGSMIRVNPTDASKPILRP